ncbi:MAG: hypothetical protein FJ090_11685 [Deltaproteobacteria bacterium]|nr:hypothetical protein [Deltaproteobacteria bacterium]
MVLLAVALIASPALAGAKASNFRKESKQSANYWNAGSAIDGKLETAWMLPGETANRGEWIEIDVPRGEIDKIGLVAGWDKDEESFKDYPRVKQVRVDVYTLDNDQTPLQVGTANLDVADQRGWQVLDIPDVKVGEDSFFGGKVRISVVDIYEGDDFPNLGVSEACVYLKEFDAAPKVIAPAGIDALFDNNAKTLWTGAAGAEFTVTPGGFAISSVGFVGDKGHGRAKTVKLTAGNMVVEATLADKPDAQWVSLKPFNGYVGSTIDDVVITVVDVHPSATNDLALQELKFKASYFEGI